MIEDFFEIGLDYNDPALWYLGQPATVDGKLLPGTFWNCVPWADTRPLSVEIKKSGVPATFSHSGHSVYIVKTEAMNLLRDIVDPHIFQGIPVSIVDYAGDYEVLNSLTRVDCVDEQHSEFRRWTAADGRPERIGDYKMSLFRIDPERARGHDLFRVKGWEIVLVCSEKVRRHLESAGVTGIRFKSIVYKE